MIKKVIRLFLLFSFGICSVISQVEERIPFYEDFIESGNLNGYLELAHDFLDENADSKEAPRVALDLIMMGKAAENLQSVVRGTDLLLFEYLGTLPSLHFISSFDKGSPRLTKLLKVKTDEADLNRKSFPQSFADAILLLARIHGPELMSDPSLLLRTHLIAKLSDNKKLSESLETAIEVTKEKNSNFKSLILICQDMNSSLEKISRLRKVNHPEADFCIRYFTALLSTEEKNSQSFVESTIESALFGVNSKADLALTYLSNLPNELSTTPKYQTYTAFAHLLKGNEESAMAQLKILSESSTNSSDTWIESARSLSDGIEFGKSRKTLFLDQVDKLYKRWQRQTKVFLIEGSWIHPIETQAFHFQIGVDKNREMIAIHIQQDGNPFLSYEVSKDGCKIFTPSGKNMSFPTGGAYPLPKVEINRNPETGSFNYSFNLNFGRKFEDFLEQSDDNLNVSYFSTTKGREVLLSHFLEQRGIWFSPPASSDRGTVFTLNKIDPKISSKHYKIEISGSGELVFLELGKLRIKNFSQGTAELMNNLPAWPVGLSDSKEGFELSMLFEAIGDLMKITASEN